MMVVPIDGNCSAADSFSALAYPSRFRATGARDETASNQSLALHEGVLIG
jgi:hypothetical protein